MRDRRTCTPAVRNGEEEIVSFTEVFDPDTDLRAFLTQTGEIAQRVHDEVQKHLPEQAGVAG